MRAVQTTLFVLVLLVLGTQTLRHVYVKWVEPKGSVLDEFREPVEEDIAASRDLEDLKRRYAKARADREAYEKGKSLEEIHLSQETGRAAYRDEQELRAAIERVEGQDRELFRLWFYWTCGLASALLGLLAYARVDRWLGMVGLIAGFVEMAVWTSPLWRTWGPQASFEALLDAKLALSAVSLVLLVALWLGRGRAMRRAAPSAA